MAKLKPREIDPNASQEERQTAALEAIADILASIQKEVRSWRKGDSASSQDKSA